MPTREQYPHTSIVRHAKNFEKDFTSVITNAQPQAEIDKKDLDNLQQQNRHLARNCFTKLWNNKEIESNRLKIANLEDQIYGGTEINARAKQEIKQQKTLHNVVAKNSTRNNPTNQR